VTELPRALEHSCEEVAGRLRSLAKDYSQGRLNLEAYRRLRTSLLDSLTALPSPVPRARSRVRWIRALVLGLVVGAAVGGLLIRDRIRGDLHWGRAPSYPRQAVPASADRVFGLIAPMLDNPDWGDARIASVNAGLLEEGPRKIAADQETQWFQRFAEEVRSRLKEQQAMAADRLVPEKSSLAALAVTIGLDLEALDEPLESPGRGDSRSPDDRNIEWRRPGRSPR
jgi:hypothetical protein